MYPTRPPSLEPKRWLKMRTWPRHEKARPVTKRPQRFPIVNGLPLESLDSYESYYALTKPPQKKILLSKKMFSRLLDVFISSARAIDNHDVGLGETACNLDAVCDSVACLQGG